MYTGKKGARIFKEHVERFEKSGQNPWSFFMIDTTLIEELFGPKAVTWALKKRRQELKDYMKKWESFENPIKEINLKDESELEDLP